MYCKRMETTGKDMRGRKQCEKKGTGEKDVRGRKQDGRM